MSHITVAQTTYAYLDEELLLKSLEGLGIVRRNAPLYRIGVGQTSSTYDIVLSNPKNQQQTMGWHRNKDGVFVEFVESMGSQWQRAASVRVADRYCAFSYQAQLVEEGWETTVVEHENGLIELEAVEAA